MKEEITIIDTTATEINKVVTQYELQGASADALQDTFTPLFAQAKEWREKASEIKVTNIGQTKAMGDARKARLEIRAVRLEAEKAKTRLKADSLRYGNAVQGAYNMILLLTEPVEKYLQDQEDYGKRMQERMQDEQRQWREIEAGKYLEFFPKSINIGAIADEEFAKLLHYATAQWNEREAEKNRVENERIERERIQAEEREAMRVENDRLRAENERIEAERRKEREAIEKERREKQAEIERINRENDERIAAEQAAKAKLEREQQAKELAEKQRIEAERQAKEAAEKAALNASDKVKIETLITEIKRIKIPDFAVKGSKQRVSSLIFDLEIELLKIVE